MMKEVKKEKTYAPMPNTVRGYTTSFVSSPDGKFLAYGSRTTVVLRSLDDLSDIKIFTKHLKNITALCFHPTDPLIATVDENNTMYIWDYNTLQIKKEIPQVKIGKTNGIIFSGIPDVLIVYGEGKGNFAKAFNINKPERALGEFTLNSTILAGDASKDNSGICLLGGEDHTVSVWKGQPYQLVKKYDKVGVKFVTGIATSPDGTKILTVGMDKNIFIFDAKTGEQIEQIANDKSEGNHKMSIMTVRWIDNDRFVTGSLDKTIKIWSLSEKKVLLTLNTAEKPQIDQMICGLVATEKSIVGLTLNGQICEWKMETAVDGKLPDLILDGHNAAITKLCYLKQTKEFISCDNIGKIFKWNDAGIATLMRNREKSIQGMYVSAEEKYLYCIERDNSITATQLSDFKELWKIVPIGQTIDVRVSEADSETIYVLYRDIISIYKKEGLVKKEKLNYRASSLEVNETTKEIYIGDEKGKIHIVDLENLSQKQLLDNHISQITIIRLSPDKKLFASGDSSKYIYIWSAETKECVNNRCVFHSGKIYDLSWASDSNYLFSASLDSSVGMFKNDENKIKQFPKIDSKEITNVIVINDEKDFLCCGSTGVMYKIKSEQ